MKIEDFEDLPGWGKLSDSDKEELRKFAKFMEIAKAQGVPINPDGVERQRVIAESYVKVYGAKKP